MREESAPSESQRMIIEVALRDMEKAQEQLDLVCRSGGVAQITLEAAQTSVLINKARIATILHLFGWDDTNELRAELKMNSGSVYVHRRILEPE